MSTKPARAEDRPVADVVNELRRQLSPFAPRPTAPRRALPTGITLLDEALGGGLPRGRVVELVGSAGRMTCALAALASAISQGHLAAFIDGANALDPACAQALGVNLSRLLWLYPGSPTNALRAAELLLDAEGFALLVLYLCDVKVPDRLGAAWLRLQQRAEKTDAALLLVSDRALAGSCPVVTLRLVGARSGWERVPGGRLLLRGQRVRLEVLRSRLGPPGDVGDLALPKK